MIDPNDITESSVLYFSSIVISNLTAQKLKFQRLKESVFLFQIRYSSLTEAVRLLGCFSIETEIQPVPNHLKPREETEFSELFCKLREQKYVQCINLPCSQV